MGDGFIGMDPILAKRNIDEFRTAFINVEAEFCYAVKELFRELSFAWVSSKAVEFYETYNLECDELYGVMVRAELAICQGAWRAYNIMATSLGCQTISEDYGYDANVIIKGDINLEKLVDNKNGIRGMNTQLVKNHILPAFENNIKDVYNYLTEVPTSIALYDAEGEQSGAYATGIGEIKIKIETLLDNIKTSIYSAIESEVDTLLLAKQQSTDAMKNMNA